MRNLHLPAGLRRIRREAAGITPELARLGDAVGDTLSAATAAATSTANHAAHRITRRVRRQRASSTRKRAFALIALAGVGIAIAMLTRRTATPAQPTQFPAGSDAAGPPAPSTTTLHDDTQITPPSGPIHGEYAATARAQSAS